MATDETTEGKPAAAPPADPFAIVPAEIPAKAMSAMARNMRLVEALQNVVAGGLKDKSIHPVDAGRLVASLTKANDSLARLHALFEPRALNEGQKKADPKSPVAQAAARKLMALLDGDVEDAEVVDLKPEPITPSSVRPRPAKQPDAAAPDAPKPGRPDARVYGRPGRAAPPRAR